MIVQRTRPASGAGIRLLAILLVIWFAIGAIAAGQRHYFSGGAANCAHAGTIFVTVLAGPLNYVGANPKISNCQVPQPSK
jgi:membrane protein YdbS with pleckstrin-like domain